MDVAHQPNKQINNKVLNIRGPEGDSSALGGNNGVPLALWDEGRQVVKFLSVQLVCPKEIMVSQK